ncbi:hypothetical protein H9638_07000 [Arthrobacter sp. Sa2BUA2]|uniref:Uncharacterized protein n=1 Tax=Arthrobacter pullicola TaxID=2762224 RepID=A0ABR8YHE7_9MICC|nr:hypothetical protein [Arthrobacter pullicola]MBD8043557.1 hypothetical protein [Arthrobacter pullicola]
MTAKVQRSKWGRARVGGGTPALLGAALVIGALIATGCGALFSWLRNGENPLMEFAVMAAAVLPVAAALAWAVLVDRSTLAGAVDKPEDSVESAWYDKAASGAFTDILLVAGISCAAVAFLGIEGPASLILAVVVLFSMLDFGARYLWLKKLAGA